MGRSGIRPASPVGPELFGPAARLALLVDGRFNHLSAKTAFGILRFAPNPVAAVIDRVHAGRTVREVTGIARDTPIVATAGGALALGAEVLVIGIAPRGGILPEAWRAMVLAFLESGADVAAGLHTFLGDDPEFSAVARRRDRRIWDVRRPPQGIGPAAGRCRALAGKRIIYCAGMDCCTGKKTTAIFLAEALRRRGVRAAWVPTGQTGIFIAGWGIAVDRVPGWLAAGAVERLVLHAAREADVILVEGQGSLLHPGYSGVTLACMHGAMATAMTLSVPATPVDILEEYGIEPPPLRDAVALHEHLMRPLRPARVVGIALNTCTVEDDGRARAMVEKIAGETGLPTVDGLRFGADALAQAVMD